MTFLRAKYYISQRFEVKPTVQACGRWLGNRLNSGVLLLESAMPQLAKKLACRLIRSGTKTEELMLVAVWPSSIPNKST